MLVVVASPTVKWSSQCLKLSELHNCPFKQLESGWLLRATPAHPLFLSHGLSQIVWRVTIGNEQEVTESLTAIWCFRGSALRHSPDQMTDNKVILQKYVSVIVMIKRLKIKQVLKMH